MIRSTICAGTAGLLSMTCIMPTALAEAPLNVAEFMMVERDRAAIHPKPALSKGASYEDVLTAASNHPNAYAGEDWITELLEDEALQPQHRPRVLYARAQHRWKKSSNRIGAWQDFTRFTELYPDDLYAKNAGIEAGYVKSEIDRIKARMEELQTLSIWFEDAWLLGMRDEAAGRYKRSGFTPEPREVEQLRAAGYVCNSAPENPPATLVPVAMDNSNLYWCR